MSSLNHKMRRIARATEIDQAYLTERRRLARSALWLRRQLSPYYFVAPPWWRIWLRSQRRSARAVPGFASLGAVRSGTSSFSDYLLQHPCAVLPLAKEPAAVTTRRAFLAQFPTEREMRRVEREHGAAVTGYCGPSLPRLSVLPHLYALSPDLRVILLLRDPVERTFAHYRWDQRLFERTSVPDHRPEFPEIIRQELQSIERGTSPGGFALVGARMGYVQNSTYLPFVEEVYRLFGRDQVLCLQSEAFFEDSAAVAKQAYAFLGLPTYEPASQPVRNSARQPGKVRILDDETRGKLAEHFRPHNSGLFELIGQSFDWT